MKRLFALIALSLTALVTFAKFSGVVTDAQGIKYTANEDEHVR